MTIAVTGPGGSGVRMPGLGIALDRARHWLRRHRQEAVLRLVEARLREDAGLPCAPPPEAMAPPCILPAWSCGPLTEARDGTGRRNGPGA